MTRWAARLELTREQILAYRRRVGALDARLPYGPASLRVAAWAGLQDSMPRAALLSIHARVTDTPAEAWQDPALVQVWGPRYSAYVIAADDVWVFTLGRLPDDERGRQRAYDTAARLSAFLAGRRMNYEQAGVAMGVNPNSLRYAAPTGTVLLRWEGSRRPTIWNIPAPEVDPFAARLELARRYLHVFGPATVASFSEWAGIGAADARRAWAGLAAELVPTSTPIGESSLLAADEPLFVMPPDPPARARLLPSGDTYYLLQGAARELLVPDARLRSNLWTSRVWPGALLVGGEIVGVWRRAESLVSVDLWRPLTAGERVDVEREASALPLPGISSDIRVDFKSSLI